MSVFKKLEDLLIPLKYKKMLQYEINYFWEISVLFIYTV